MTTSVKMRSIATVTDTGWQWNVERIACAFARAGFVSITDAGVEIWGEEMDRVKWTERSW